jgi:hypothetical protein
VLPLGTVVEVAAVGAIHLVKAVEDVLGGVAVDDVQQYDQAETVGRVNELLEVLGGAVATAGCEEAVDLVAETGVVSVLHDGHELDHVVAQVFDAGQHVLGELLVGGDAELG